MQQLAKSTIHVLTLNWVKSVRLLPAQQIALRSVTTISDPAGLEVENEEHEKERNSRPDMPDSNMENPYLRRKKKCVLCRYQIRLDYKNTRLLSQFISPYTGKLYNKHITGLCEAQQKLLSQEVFRAYVAGFLSNYYKSPQYLADPKLFDPAKPTRRHPF